MVWRETKDSTIGSGITALALWRNLQRPTQRVLVSGLKYRIISVHSDGCQELWLLRPNTFISAVTPRICFLRIEDLICGTSQLPKNMICSHPYGIADWTYSEGKCYSHTDP